MVAFVCCNVHKAIIEGLELHPHDAGPYSSECEETVQIGGIAFILQLLQCDNCRTEIN